MADEKIGTRKKYGIAAMVVLFALFINFTPRLVYINTTRSIPLGVYIVIPGMNLRHGDIVVYDPPEEVKKLVRERGYGTGNEHFLKHVGGLTGDFYGVSDEKIFVNGENKGAVQRQDDAGNPMPVEDGLHIVGEGEFLPLGEKVNSLDGRYMGTVPLKNIITRVVPFITEW